MPVITELSSESEAKYNLGQPDPSSYNILPGNYTDGNTSIDFKIKFHSSLHFNEVEDSYLEGSPSTPKQVCESEGYLNPDQIKDVRLVNGNLTAIFSLNQDNLHCVYRATGGGIWRDRPIKLMDSKSSFWFLAQTEVLVNNHVIINATTENSLVVGYDHSGGFIESTKLDENGDIFVKLNQTAEPISNVGSSNSYVIPSENIKFVDGDIKAAICGNICSSSTGLKLKLSADSCPSNWFVFESPADIHVSEINYGVACNKLSSNKNETLEYSNSNKELFTDGLCNPRDRTPDGDRPRDLSQNNGSGFLRLFQANGMCNLTKNVMDEITSSVMPKTTTTNIPVMGTSSTTASTTTMVTPSKITSGKTSSASSSSGSGSTVQASSTVAMGKSSGTTIDTILSSKTSNAPSSSRSSSTVQASSTVARDKSSGTTAGTTLSSSVSSKTSGRSEAGVVTRGGGSSSRRSTTDHGMLSTYANSNTDPFSRTSTGAFLPSSNSSSRSNLPAIGAASLAGSIAGGILGLVLAIVLVFVLYKRCNSKSKPRTHKIGFTAVPGNSDLELTTCVNEGFGYDANSQGEASSSCEVDESIVPNNEHGESEGLLSCLQCHFPCHSLVRASSEVVVFQQEARGKGVSTSMV